MSYSNQATSNALRIVVFTIIAVMMGVGLYFMMTSPGIIPKDDDYNLDAPIEAEAQTAILTPIAV